MNKYIVPICDLIDAHVGLLKISARNLSECQEKIIRKYADRYDDIDECSYNEFRDIMDTKHDIAIGDITDVETL